MLLGACLDAGLPLDDCARALGSLGARRLRGGVASACCGPASSATRWRLDERVPAGRGPAAAGRRDAAPRTRSAHPPSPRSPQIEQLIARSALAPAARDRAIALFRRLAAIEADIHQMPIEDVHLHEVGALDSIIDIVGGVFALEWFGADRIVASPLNVGQRHRPLRARHVPGAGAGDGAAAAGRAGLPGRAGRRADDADRGAARHRLRRRASGRCRRCASTRIGYGAGEPRLRRIGRTCCACWSARPRPAGRRAGRAQRVTLMTFEIDDMNPQIYGVADGRAAGGRRARRLLHAGADEEEPARARW